MTPRRILVHLSEREQRVLDPLDVYYLESGEGTTHVRLRGRTPLVDQREIGEVTSAWEDLGFVRIHRHYTVNIARIHTVRLQADGRDWEVKLEPPVNAVLPVARDRLEGLRRVLGRVTAGRVGGMP